MNIGMGPGRENVDKSGLGVFHRFRGLRVGGFRSGGFGIAGSGGTGNDGLRPGVAALVMGVAIGFRIAGGDVATAVDDDQAGDDLDILLGDVGPARDLADQAFDRLGVERDAGIGELRCFFEQVLQSLEHLLHRLHRVVEPLYRTGERPELEIQPLDGVGHVTLSPESLKQQCIVGRVAHFTFTVKFAPRQGWARGGQGGD